MSQLEQMALFKRVVESGTITKAAEQTGTTKSLISRKLKQLETRLNVSLLTRTTRTMQLTEAGQNYYQHCVQILEQIDMMESQLGNSEAALSGSLTVSIPYYYARKALLTVLHRFNQAHPKVAIKLIFSDARNELITEGIDVAIRIGELTDSSLKAKALADVDFVIVATPQYLAQFGTPRTPSELSQHKLLHYSNAKEKKWRFTTGEVLEYQAAFSSNNGQFLYQMCKEGLGIARLPTFIAQQGIARQEVVPLLPHYPCGAFKAWAVYPNQQLLNRKARLFIDYLSEAINKN